MKILVHSHKFEISEPYAPGHKLTQAEAKALNSLRARRIARQADYKLHRGVLTSPKQLELAQGVVTDLDKNFSFEGQRSPSPRPSAFETKLWEVARERVQETLGHYPSEISGGDLFQSMLNHPEVREEALRRASLAQELAETQMAEILGVTSP